MSDTKIHSTLLSKFQKTEVAGFHKLPDLTGLTLGEFQVDTRLDIASGEADIYLCSGTGNCSGKNFLLKYYRRENAVKSDVLEKLKAVNSPFVAPVVGAGVFRRHQYVVRPYYEMSALSESLAAGTRFSEDELKTVIIPSVAEGLKAVHDAGILHKDLKPANLIPDDTGEHIVLIDFGISSDAGKNTLVVTKTGITPLYAAPEALQGIFHRETDYYALGISVFELFTGYAPFQDPSISPEEAAKLSFISVIEFPGDFPDDLKKLVLGLTYKDISHRNELDNPNRRWGYEEIMKWLKGEDVPVPGEGLTRPAVQVFLPYTLGRRKLSTPSDLIRTLLRAPEQGIRELARGKLTQHYGYFDQASEELCRQAEEEIGSSEDSNYLVFFRLMYRLSAQERSLFCGGSEFEGIRELASAVVDEAVALAEDGGWLGTDRTSRFLEEVILMFRSGALEFYALDVIGDPDMGELLHKLKELHAEDVPELSPVQQSLVIGYNCSENFKLAVLGVAYSSPREFADVMAQERAKDPLANQQQLFDARQELEFLLANILDPGAREPIQHVYDVVRSAVFGDFEYQFRDADDFIAFVEQQISDGNTYLVRSILNRYGPALQEISVRRHYWKSSAYTVLKKAVDRMIPLGEYLFANEKDFARFVHDLEEQGKHKPLFLRDFVIVHEQSLRYLLHRREHRVSKLARSLLRHIMDREETGHIMIWGNIFPSRGSCFPGTGYGLDLISDYDDCCGQSLVCVDL